MNETIDSTTDEVVDETPVANEPVQTENMAEGQEQPTKEELLQSVKSMLAQGQIGGKEAAHIRNQLGFSQANYTRNRFNKVKRNAKNKAAKKARKANRGR